jgi:DNA gyrase subunit A
MEIGIVRQIDIDQEMQSAYLDYAMSVIVARALPDVRDGLKPVHRRILYAMHDMGLRPDRPYKKSARIVGEVLGKYHPHGDAAVYEAMARMAQDFSLRYVLVDGQGNFGSVDGDSPAAMRYTEARTTNIAEEMLADIDKDTVEFLPNFDGTLREPAILPATSPNLLINGASGIAVGMATNVPPHNLREVCDALVYLIDHYESLDDVTVEDLTRFIHGPDFPTGGIVYRYDGQEGDGDRTDLIRNAYALGRGRLTLQANVHIEEMSRNRNRLVVTELPYQVNKTRLIERIADLVRDGRLEGIADLRDESDRQGMRICVELTRTVDPRQVLAQLFKLTPMQTTFGLRMLALVDGEPRLLSLKRVLVHYLRHRQEVITRRTRYLLERARERAQVLEGLLKALDDIDQVIAMIRRAETVDVARTNLMKGFDLTEIQAQAILDMPLKRLAALERREIENEHLEKLQNIRYLEELLRSPARIRGVIREELLALEARYGDARRTRIVELEKGYHTARDLVDEKDVLLTLWQDGQVSRSATPPRLSSTAVPAVQAWGNTRDDIVFLTASGYAVMIPLHQIPDGQSVPLSSLADLDRPETPVAALILPRLPDGEELPETYLTLLTRQGRIKRVTLEDFLSTAGRGAVTAINVEEGDELAWAIMTTGHDEFLLATRQGKAIRFSEEDVRPMGLSAAGVWAIKLVSGDAVVGMGRVRDGTFVVIFTEQGYAKRTAIESFPLQKRYGGGVQAAKLSTQTGRVAVAVVAAESQDIVLTTARGQISRLPVQTIQAVGRAAVGSKSPQDSREFYLDFEKHGPPVRLAVLIGTGETAKAESTRRTQGTTPQSGEPAPAASRPKKAPRGRRRSGRSKEATVPEDHTDLPEGRSRPTSAPSRKGKTTPRKRKSVRTVPKSESSEE